MHSEALKLANEIGITNEHPDFPVTDWKQAVANDETRESYWNWVLQELRNAMADFMDGDAEHQLSLIL